MTGDRKGSTMTWTYVAIGIAVIVIGFAVWKFSHKLKSGEGKSLSTKSTKKDTTAAAATSYTDIQ